MGFSTHQDDVLDFGQRHCRRGGFSQPVPLRYMTDRPIKTRIVKNVKVAWGFGVHGGLWGDMMHRIL